MDFLAWFGKLIEYLGSWVPRPQPLYHTEMAVVMSVNTFLILWESWWWLKLAMIRVKKRPPKFIDGGTAIWYIPALTDITTFSKLDIPMPIGEFPLLGPDGEQLIIDCECMYRIKDAMIVAFQADDIEVSLGVVMTACIQEIVLGYESLSDLNNAFVEGQVHAELLEAVNTKVERMGVVFVSTTLVLGQAVVLHHTGNVQKQSNE